MLVKLELKIIKLFFHSFAPERTMEKHFIDLKNYLKNPFYGLLPNIV